MIDLEPDEADHWILRGQCAARFGRFASASNDYRRAIELDPKRASDHCEGLMVADAAGDAQEYERRRTAALEQFSSVDVVLDAEQLARACLVRRASQTQLEQIHQMVAQIQDVKNGHPNWRGATLSRAILLYRQATITDDIADDSKAKLRDLLRHVNRAKSPGMLDSLSVIGDSVAAMALHQLGRGADARRALASAAYQLRNSDFPYYGELLALEPNWTNQLFARSIYAEAGRLIVGLGNDELMRAWQLMDTEKAEEATTAFLSALEQAGDFAPIRRQVAEAIDDRLVGIRPIIFSGLTRSVPWQYCSKQPAEGWWTAEDAETTEAWSEENGPFGHDRFTAAPVRGWSSETDLWIRNEFQLEKNPTFSDLLFRVRCRDNAKIFLNGVLALEVHGSDQRQTLRPSAEALATLQAGQNWIAIHARCSSGKNAFDLGVYVASENGTKALREALFSAVPQSAPPSERQRAAVLAGQWREAGLVAEEWIAKKIDATSIDWMKACICHAMASRLKQSDGSDYQRVCRAMIDRFQDSEPMDIERTLKLSSLVAGAVETAMLPSETIREALAQDNGVSGTLRPWFHLCLALQAVRSRQFAQAIADCNRSLEAAGAIEGSRLNQDCITAIRAVQCLAYLGMGDRDQARKYLLASKDQFADTLTIDSNGQILTSRRDQLIPHDALISYLLIREAERELRQLAGP